MVNYKNPPEFVEGNYTHWKKELEVWKIGTDVPKAKHGAVVALSLRGKARSAAMMVAPAEMNKEEGLAKVIEELDKLYSVDTLQSTFIAIEDLEGYSRSPDTSISEYITEFGRRNDIVQDLRKQPAYEDGILAYRLLKQANLKPSEEQVIRATLGDLTFANMVTALKRTFGDRTISSLGSSSSGYKPSIKIKDEPVYYQDNTDEHYDQTYGYEEETYYNTHYNRGKHYSRDQRGSYANRKNFRGQSSGFKSRGGFNQHHRGREHHRGGFHQQRGAGNSNQGAQNQSRTMNAIDPSTGKPSQCAVCNSIFHWARKCPDSHENRTRITLFQSHSDDFNIDVDVYIYSFDDIVIQIKRRKIEPNG